MFENCFMMPQPTDCPLITQNIWNYFVNTIWSVYHCGAKGNKLDVILNTRLSFNPRGFTPYPLRPSPIHCIVRHCVNLKRKIRFVSRSNAIFFRWPLRTSSKWTQQHWWALLQLSIGKAECCSNFEKETSRHLCFFQSSDQSHHPVHKIFMRVYKRNRKRRSDQMCILYQVNSEVIEIIWFEDGKAQGLLQIK